ncbi:hypothetical protein RSSM_03341 [Rhodopirellula sallentina SM41]|uniref:Uncharacterized protein n=1 Tax=Rhodopirellula sallentina SM41 TaxID=1263870 RepID=M5U1R8_9BACT|nr:hypothetical protein RSSM_03341 [Rhodopirellula sallentina SM41]
MAEQNWIRIDDSPPFQALSPQSEHSGRANAKETEPPRRAGTRHQPECDRNLRREKDLRKHQPAIDDAIRTLARFLRINPLTY